MEKRQCYGCGSELQSVDPTLPGYVAADVLARNEPTIVCQRCFQLKNYGTLKEVSIKNSEFLELLEKIKQTECLIVYVLDVFNFHSSLIKNLDHYLGNNPVIVVLNKIDILPKSTVIGKVKNYVAETLWKRNIFPIDVIPVCARTGEHIDILMDSIFDNRDHKDVYIIGMANVGKSSIINQLLKIYSNETTHFITTSQFPGTTLHTIEIPLDETTFLYDTPGVINERSMWQSFEFSVLKKMLPRTQIKPRTYQLNEGQTILVGGICAVEFEKGPRSSFTFVLSNEIQLERVKSANKEASFAAMYANKQLIPSSKSFKSFESFVKIELDIPASDINEIIIYGLGQIRLVHCDGNQRVNLFLPSGVKAIIRSS